MTRHPQKGAAELPCGNSAGTLAESAPCSARPHKHWGLRVYVGQREWNQTAKRKTACARLPRGNARLLRRERVESKGSRRERASRRAYARVASAAVAVKGLRSLRDAQRTRALDRRPRCGCFAAMRKMYFSR